MPLSLHPFNRGLQQAANGRRLVCKYMRRTQAPMPMVGLSTEGMAPAQAAAAVAAGLKIGYRFFDIAEEAGHTVEVGKVLDDAMSQQNIPRLDLFVLYRMICEAEDAEERVTTAVKDLDCGYLDLVVPHFTVDHTKTVTRTIPAKGSTPEREVTGLPLYDHKAYMALYRKMESWVPPTGRITRHIGISNVINAALHGYLRDCKVQPDVVLNESHLLMQLNGTKQRCDKYDCPLVAHTICPPPVPATTIVQQACKAKQLTPLQLSVKWSLQRHVPCLVNTDDPQALSDAFDAACMPEDGGVLLLKAAEMNALGRLDKGPAARTYAADTPELWDEQYAEPPM